MLSQTQGGSSAQAGLLHLHRLQIQKVLLLTLLLQLVARLLDPQLELVAVQGSLSFGCLELVTLLLLCLDFLTQQLTLDLGGLYFGDVGDKFLLNGCQLPFLDCAGFPQFFGLHLQDSEGFVFLGPEGESAPLNFLFGGLQMLMALDLLTEGLVGEGEFMDEAAFLLKQTELPSMVDLEFPALPTVTAE